MTTNTSAVRTKAALSPLRIVSSVLFLLFGILSAISAFLNTGYILEGIEFWSAQADAYEYEPEFHNQAMLLLLKTQYSLVLTIATPFAAVAIAVFGLIARQRWLQAGLGAGLFLASVPVLWIFDLLVNGSIFMFLPDESIFGLARLLCLVLAIVLSIVAAVLTPKTAQGINQPDLAVTPQSSPAAKNPAAQTTGQSNLNNLPMFALIGAFIVPLAGIILGHLSLSYMKKGQLSTQNKGMATAGLILGYVFVGLGFLTGLILVIVLIVSAASGF